MAEKLVENQFCQACGADVRLNALYCYNCGSQVASDEEVAAETQNGNKVSSAWFKDSISEVKMTEKPKVTAQRAQTEVKKRGNLDPSVQQLARKDPFKTESEIKTDGLKTAASLRKRPNPFPRKKVEVTWESYENAPNVWFLVVSIILTAFAVLILFAMLYIR